MLIAKEGEPNIFEAIRWLTRIRLNPQEKEIRNNWALFLRYIPRESLSLTFHNQDLQRFEPNLNYESWSIDYLTRLNFERLIANYSENLEDRGRLLKGLNNLCNQLAQLNLMGLKNDMTTGSIGFIHNEIKHKGFYPIGFKDVEEGKTKEGLANLNFLFNTIVYLEQKGGVKVADAGTDPQKFSRKLPRIGEIITVGISWDKNSLAGGSRLDCQEIDKVQYINSIDPLYVKLHHK